MSDFERAPTSMEEAAKVPEDIRLAALGDLLAAANRGEMTYEDFIQQCSIAIAHTAVGHMTPEQSNAARGWAELQFTAIVARAEAIKELQDKTNGAKKSVAQKISDAQKKARAYVPQITLDLDTQSVEAELLQPNKEKV